LSEKIYFVMAASLFPDEVIGVLPIYLILPVALWPCGLLNLEQKCVPGIFLGVKALPEHKADNLTAICESIV
jgi:hypothetical protein